VDVGAIRPMQSFVHHSVPEELRTHALNFMQLFYKRYARLVDGIRTGCGCKTCNSCCCGPRTFVDYICLLCKHNITPADVVAVLMMSELMQALQGVLPAESNGEVKPCRPFV
jgi:hypothetical protein